MPSRLDRLIGLLSTGANLTIRHRAALELGQLAAKDDLDLSGLLLQILKALRSRAWDTRAVAAKALQHICTNVSPNHGLRRNPTTCSPLSLDSFKLESVIENGAPLLASEGLEMNLADGLTPVERLAAQRRKLEARLGLVDAELTSQLLQSSDLVSAAAVPEDASARQRNRQLRLARDQLAASARDEIESGLRVLESIAAAQSPLDDGWPFAPLCEDLLFDIFSPIWEIRHGAAIGLREVLSKQGQDAHDSRPHDVWIEDCALRLVCLLALDRFGDWGGDLVHAPVRDAGAQALSCALLHMSQRQCDGIIELLLALVAHSRWELKYGGILGLRYAIATRPELISQTAVRQSVVGALVGTDDDVRAVAGESLLPFVSGLEAMQSLPSMLWGLLPSMTELSVSAAPILELLAALPVPVDDNVLLLAESLFSFLRHRTVRVRRACLRALGVLLLGPWNGSTWLPSRTVNPAATASALRFVLQNLVLETADSDTIRLSESLWFALVSHSSADIRAIALELLPSWFSLLIVPPTAAISPRLLLFPEASQTPAAESTEDGVKRRRLEDGSVSSSIEGDAVAPRSLDDSLAVRFRIAQALGRMSAVWPVEHQDDIGQLVTRLLKWRPPSSVYVHAASLVLQSWGAGVLWNEIDPLLSHYLSGSHGWSECEAYQTLLLAEIRSFLGLLYRCGTPKDTISQWASISDVGSARRLSQWQPALVPSAPLQEVASARASLVAACDALEAERLGAQRMVAAGAAGAILVLNGLPDRVSPLLKALLGAVKAETQPQLQDAAAEHLALAISLCPLRQPCPNDKLIPQLADLLDYVPVDETAPNESEAAVLVAEESVPQQKRLKAAAALSVAAVLADEGIAFRGATTVFRCLAHRTGSTLFESIPQLWLLIDSMAGRQALNVLVAIGKEVHPDLLERLIAVVSKTAKHLCSAENRSCAAAALSALCVGSGSTRDSVVTEVLRVLLPMAEDQDAETRVGALEGLRHVAVASHVGLIPWLRWLVAPALGAMVDLSEAVRSVGAHLLSIVVQLVPLSTHQGAVEIVGLPETDDESSLLMQVLDGGVPPPWREALDLRMRDVAQIRSYQREGIDWLGFLRRSRLHGALCDDMGLGKTLQVLVAMAADARARTTPLPSLVVCPSSLVSHWVSEAQKWLPDYRAVAWHDAKRRKILESAQRGDVHLVVASYSTMRVDVLLSQQSWAYVVLDEAHLLKNPRTSTFRSVKRLRGAHRLIVTGTPIQNNLLEAWSLFDFLMPGFLVSSCQTASMPLQGTEAEFRRKFTNPVKASQDPNASDEVLAMSATALESLHRQLLPFILRRLKEDVLKDLPSKIIQDVLVDLTEAQSWVYARLSRGKSHVFQSLRLLRRACNSPALALTQAEANEAETALSLPSGSLNDARHAAKLGALYDVLVQCGIGNEDEGNAHRVLVFSQGREMLDLVESELFRKQCVFLLWFMICAVPSVVYARLDGSVPASDRDELVRRFNQDSSISALLLTTAVGGLGLNLTGADVVVFIDHDWNPMRDLQAMDRAHRLGQTRVVNVFRLVTRGTLEEKIMSLQRFKIHVANTVVSQQNTALASMDTGDVIDLVSDGAVLEQMQSLPDEEQYELQRQAFQEGLK